MPEDDLQNSHDARLHLLMSQLAHRNDVSRNRVALCLLGGLICPAIVLTALDIAKLLDDSGIVGISSFLVVEFVIVMLYFRFEKRDWQRASELAGLQDMRSVGLLLECMSIRNSRTVKNLTSALTVLLPLMAEGDAEMLTSKHREVLNMLLYRNSRDLAMAVLYSLGAIGDGTAMPYLQSMAAGIGIPDVLWNDRAEVQVLAKDILVNIAARIEAQNRSSVLLRASDKPVVPAQQLVRAVCQDAQPAANELLRPSAEG